MSRSIVGRASGTLYILGAVCYFGLISILSHIPGETLDGLDWNIWDKAAHFIAYFPLGFLAAMGMSRRPFRFTKMMTVIVGVVLVAALGAVDEFHQSFVPGRFVDSSDALADVLGGSLGVVFGSSRFFTRR